MFNLLFGRRKADDGETVCAVEATEEKPQDINHDGFVFLEDSTTPLNGMTPPPGYTVGGANAFLPYGIDPKSTVTRQSSVSSDSMTAIDGIPFRFGSNVLLEDKLVLSPSISTEDMMSKIKSFNWDDYEYSFELERSIMRELISGENNHN